jgi:quercetin dioxygenase-like cupin family protein
MRRHHSSLVSRHEDSAMSIRLPHLIGSTLLLALAWTGSGAQAQEATPAAQPKRTILDQHEQSGVPGTEIVLGTAELPAGTVVGWHVHDGDESGYVLKGNLILKTRGKPDQALKAGDHFFNPRGAVHSLAAAPGTDGGVALSTWIIDKGKPLAEPVK